MRRNEKAIIDDNLIQIILNESIVCRIGLCSDNVPYVLPMNFAYHNGVIYLHAASTGKKLDMINENPHVCFEMEYKAEVSPAPTSCGWSMKYYSIIGWGDASMITDSEGKTEALNLLTEKYAREKELSYTDTILDKVAIIRIEITELTGKFSGY